MLVNYSPKGLKPGKLKSPRLNSKPELVITSSFSNTTTVSVGISKFFSIILAPFNYLTFKTTLSELKPVSASSASQSIRPKALMYCEQSTPLIVTV